MSESIQKTGHRSFEMGNSCLFLCLDGCRCLPLPKVASLLDLPGLMRTCRSRGGSVISHHDYFSTFSGFPLTGSGTRE